MTRDRRPRTLFLIIAVWCCLLGFMLEAWGAEEARFALIIGYNGTKNSRHGELRYADDDAIQNATLMRELGAKVVLLTTLDAETRDLHPNERPSAPTAIAVAKSWQHLNDAMVTAHRAGKEPVFYFFYSGHGDVKYNQGYVQLRGGKLWRRELLQMLSKSNALANHIIIDACKSYFMVFKRNAGGERRPIAQGVSWQESGPIPNTGVMLSTSAAQESHEWEAFQGGVFSHELRSALRGAADLNSDGKISYREAAASIWNANQSIPNRRFRPSFFAYQPTDPIVAERGLISLPTQSDDVLHLENLPSSHYYIEDGTGSRIVDFHPTDREQLALLLPSNRTLFLKDVRAGRELHISNTGRLSLGQAEWTLQQTVARGAHHEAFVLLFNQPFGAETITVYQAWLRSETADVEESLSPWWHRSIGMGSTVFGITGLTMSLFAYHERADGSNTSSGKAAAAVNHRINTFNTLALGFYVSAGVAALAAVTVWVLFVSHSEDQPLRTNVFDLGSPMVVRF